MRARRRALPACTRIRSTCLSRRSSGRSSQGPFNAYSALNDPSSLHNKTVTEVKPGQQHDHVTRFIVTNTGVFAVIPELIDLAPTDCRVTAVYT